MSTRNRKDHILDFRCLKIQNFSYSLLFVKCETWRLKTVFYFVNDAKSEGEYVRYESQSTYTQSNNVRIILQLVYTMRINEQKGKRRVEEEEGDFGICKK